MDIALHILAGLVLLGLGGEAVVRGAVGVARKLGVSELLIGLTLVGFGTSTPETLTSLMAALKGSDGVAVGNVLGSNISNILLIAAVGALFAPIAVPRAALVRDGAMMIGASLAFTAYALVFDTIWAWTAAIMLIALGAYLFMTWRLESGKATPSADLHTAEGETVKAPGLWVSLAFAFGGIALLIFGADNLVQGAVALARMAGLSETIIGLTIVAVGTSLPELVATVASALKGRTDVAFGNVVGSNIFNILGVLGVTAAVRPIKLPLDLTPVDWGVFVGSAMLLVYHAWTGARISRAEGASLLACYLAYVVYLVLSVAAKGAAG